MTPSKGLGSNPIVAFVATTDPERAKAFYGGILGLRLASEELPFAIVFDAGGTMLRVTIVKEVAPPHHTVLGWASRDIEATVQELEAAGVVFFRLPFMSPDGPPIWDAPGGARVAWFKDPDGNTLSVSYHP
ncbi:MAG: VOC family protein [Acidobacteria bacterium]|nr:VOC family protein [Acidobacteriota bacterium]